RFFLRAYSMAPESVTSFADCPQRGLLAVAKSLLSEWYEEQTGEEYKVQVATRTPTPGAQPEQRLVWPTLQREGEVAVNVPFDRFGLVRFEVRDSFSILMFVQLVFLRFTCLFVQNESDATQFTKKHPRCGVLINPEVDEGEPDP